MIKKFSEFLSENATSEWEDALYNAAKDKLYGGEEPSIFNEIMDEAFGPEFKSEKPSKKEIKAKLLEWVEDALNTSVFTEEESEDLQDDTDSGIQENIELDPLKNNEHAYKLYNMIMDAGLGACMDVEEDKAKFLAWIEELPVEYKGTGMEFVIKKNTSWCTDNEGDMRAYLSVVFDEDLMGDFADDYESFDELKAQYR